MINAEKKVLIHTLRYEFLPETEAFEFFRIFVKHYGAEQGFLLDSITGGQVKYSSSMIGLFPVLSVRGKGDQLRIEGDNNLLQQSHIAKTATIAGDLSALLDNIMERFEVDSNLPAYAFGYLGFFGYDAIRYFEHIPETTMDDREIDDFYLQVHRIIIHFSPERIIVYVHEFDGLEGPSIADIVRMMEESRNAPVPFVNNLSDVLQVSEDVSYEDYVKRILKIKEYIAAGDVFQCVISKRIRVQGDIDTLEVYGRLRSMNPSPYMFYVSYGDYLLFGASPEMQVRMENGIVQMKPIAGTSKGKGKTSEENARLKEALFADEKERAEHVMLVDLCRNDLGRIAVPGTVNVEQLIQIEEYSHVFHLVSLITAKVRPGISSFDVFLSTFPAGTLSGAPKVRAMEIIDELEDFHRGPYGGVIGMIDCFGNLDTAIVIRTVVHQNGVSYLQAGAGIVADSDPDQEWQECNHKLGALRATLF